MVDIELRLRLLRDFAKGEGATVQRIGSFGQEALDAFEVGSAEELRRDLRRAGSVLPRSTTTSAIVFALNIQTFPGRMPETLEERRQTAIHMEMERPDYRTQIRRERRGAEELEVVLFYIHHRLRDGGSWPAIYKDSRGRLVDVPRRALYWIIHPIDEQPD